MHDTTVNALARRVKKRTQVRLLVQPRSRKNIKLERKKKTERSLG
jgi:hypothetical protein